MPIPKKQLPVRIGLWSDPAITHEKPKLTGTKCGKCGELFFPKIDNGICHYCQSNELIELELSSSGKIYSFTVVMQRPPEYYRGEVPYAIGFVELPEGIRIQTLFTGCDFDALEIGMDVELVIERLHIDEDGNEILTYKFRPSKS